MENKEGKSLTDVRLFFLSQLTSQQIAIQQQLLQVQQQHLLNLQRQGLLSVLPTSPITVPGMLSCGFYCIFIEQIFSGANTDARVNVIMCFLMHRELNPTIV